MDIRIGNDICLNVHVDNLDSYSDSDVASIDCMLIKIGECSSGEVCEKSFPQFCHPSHYSTHSCGVPCYNVIPSNVTMHYIHKFHSECVEYKLKGTPDVENNNVKILFKGQDQKHTGVFKLILDIVLKEDNWGENNEHRYTIDYGYVFTLTNCKNASCGYIVLNIKQDEIIRKISMNNVESVQYIPNQTSVDLGRITNKEPIRFTIDGIKRSILKDEQIVDTNVSKQYEIQVPDNNTDEDMVVSDVILWFDGIEIQYVFIVPPMLNLYDVIYFGSGRSYTCAQTPAYIVGNSILINVEVANKDDMVYILIPTSYRIDNCILDNFPFPMYDKTLINKNNKDWYSYHSNNLAATSFPLTLNISKIQ